MSVIVECSVPAEAFTLGQILDMGPGTRIVVETTVPVGDKTVPFIRVFDEQDRFEAAVREHSQVNDIQSVSSHDGEILYALDWEESKNGFFRGVEEFDGTILKSVGTRDRWEFELRFHTHEALSNFQTHCRESDIPLELERLYNPTKPDAGPWFGLTPAQRTALSRAVSRGYYTIPRQLSTKELAAEFDISDQAMTERLRRAITNLVTNTLQVPEEPAKP
jgi:predicted DNA binding protein